MFDQNLFDDFYFCYGSEGCFVQGLIIEQKCDLYGHVIFNLLCRQKRHYNKWPNVSVLLG